MSLSRVFRLAAALLIAGSAPQALALLQWSHFVPRYDEWFDAYAENWGEANGFKVRVDHVNAAAAAAAAHGERTANCQATSYLPILARAPLPALT